MMIVFLINSVNLSLPPPPQKKKKQKKTEKTNRNKQQKTSYFFILLLEKLKYSLVQNTMPACAHIQRQLKSLLHAI